ncbi:MAG: acyloxyacyl hydrolase [Acidobacteria bacterium]|nr:acyloxyacyl hydrolase [Acidobacteriota bacterium]
MTRHLGRGPLAGRFELLLEATPLMVVRQPERAFGVAVSLLHLRWNFAPVTSRRLRVFAEASGGLLYTSRPVPVRTTRFNFIDQAGFGLRFENRARRAFLIGYRFQHISNGGRVRPNPGANFNFLYAGVTFLR